ncbi:alpha/beta fold hydrolase [Rhodococcus sp. H29-C3]|uniref:alpha/beta fold hydrolase n=1 Tax=Rhodococcus sp. H29-C3 TaxID=3046307 RepID=UPI0024BB2798|nr:alpha/beta fold hydrolase [Rhodococcus sp. H29-C3]MDJ0362492.1 alpha/beta fold hydrolase [Rhodococcus sp. H29-C3]
MIPSPDVSALLDAAHVVREGDGPPLALAHGAGGGVNLNFAPLMEASKSDRTLIGMNYPGSGGSPMATAPLNLEELADAVVEAMVRAGHERFPVLGLSLGTAVAVTAAVRHPERVTGLVLTVGLAKSDAQSDGFLALWRRLAELEEWDGLANLMINAASPDVLTALTPELRAVALAQALENYPEGGAEQAVLAASVDVEHLLSQVSVPTLVVVAGQDRIVLPSTTRALGAGIAGAEVLEYPNAGHIFTPDETVRWIEDVASFLARHEL